MTVQNDWKVPVLALLLWSQEPSNQLTHAASSYTPQSHDHQLQLFYPQAKSMGNWQGKSKIGDMSPPLTIPQPLFTHLNWSLFPLPLAHPTPSFYGLPSIRNMYTLCALFPGLPHITHMLHPLFHNLSAVACRPFYSLPMITCTTCPHSLSEFTPH